MKKLLWATLSKDAFWNVNKKLARHIGIEEAVFLSDLISKENYFSERNQLDDQNGFFNTTKNLTDDLGISERAKKRIQSSLLNQGIVKIKKRGVPAKNYWYINHELILKIMSSQVETVPTGQDENETSSERETVPAINKNKEIKINNENKPPNSKNSEFGHDNDKTNIELDMLKKSDNLDISENNVEKSSLFVHNEPEFIGYVKNKGYDIDELTNEQKEMAYSKYKKQLSRIEQTKENKKHIENIKQKKQKSPEQQAIDDAIYKAYDDVLKICLDNGYILNPDSKLRSAIFNTIKREGIDRTLLAVKNYYIESKEPDNPKKAIIGQVESLFFQAFRIARFANKINKYDNDIPESVRQKMIEMYKDKK